jgi:hypothetical protein
MLASSRDSDVLARSFDRMAGECGGATQAKDVAKLRASIVGNGVSHPAAAPYVAGSNVEAILAVLDDAERRIATLAWPTKGDDLRRGLKTSQQRLRRSWKGARDLGNAHAAHEWRKQVKDQAAHLRLLRRVVPAKLSGRRDAEKTAAELIGEEHDLWMLSERLVNGRVPKRLAGARDRLAAVTAERRDALRRQAFEIGETFSSDRAGPLARLLADAWDAKSKQARRRARPEG